MGTLHSVEAAEEVGVANFILISTDKAVRPTNIMGASKRVCELILQARAAQPGVKTVFSMVRFGNVLGSRGSVVPRRSEGHTCELPSLMRSTYAVFGLKTLTYSTFQTSSH